MRPLPPMPLADATPDRAHAQLSTYAEIFRCGQGARIYIEHRLVMAGLPLRPGLMLSSCFRSILLSAALMAPTAIGAPVELLVNGGLEPPHTTLNKTGANGTVTGVIPNGWNDNSNIAPSHTDTVYEEETTGTISGSALKVTTAAQSGFGSGARFQMFQSFEAVAGRSFTATVWMKASANQNVTFRIRQNVSPYSPRASLTAAVTTAWQQFTLNFSPTVNETVRLDFDHGAASVLWLDEVSLLLNDGNREWFVSPTGSDANDGSIGAPFATFARAAQSLMAGDTLRLRAGTYRETLALTRSGTAAQPILIAPCNNEAVEISGCDLVSGAWTTYSGAIQRTDVVAKVWDVFVDRARMNIARYPDESPQQDMLSFTGWAQSTTSTPVDGDGDPLLGTGKVTFPNMAAQPADHWVGGYYSGRNGPNPYSAARGKITASAGNEITLSELNYFWRNVPGYTGSHLGSGYGCIYSHLNALTTATEWYWNGGTLYLQPPTGVNPATAMVEARTRIYGADLTGRSHIIIADISFHAASLKLENSQSCRVEGCTVLYPGPWTDIDPPSPDGQLQGQDYGIPDDGSAGVYITGSNNCLTRCHIAHSWGAGARLDGSNNILEDSLLEDLDWLSRRIGGVQLLGTGNQVLRCTIRRTAQSGIDGGNRLLGFGKVASNFTVNGCLIADVGLLTSDTGAFYINNQASPTLLNGVVSYNTMLRVWGALYASGVYIDNSTCGVLVHHNVINAAPNGYFGIRPNNLSTSTQSDILIYNNTVSGALNNGLMANAAGPKVNIVMQNNISTTGIGGATSASNNITNAAASHFINPGAYDYRLQAGSSAIDAGLVIAGITDGFAGSAPDCGAYESGATSTVPPLPPTLGVADVNALEDSGAAIFTLTLAAPLTVPLVVDYSTADGTAHAGSDYTAVSGSVIFAAGETNKQISVPLLDNASEGMSKTFTLSLLHPFITSPVVATGTIQDDDFVGFAAFRYSADIGFVGYTGRPALTNFPLLVKLDSTHIPGFSTSQFQSPNGYDLRFSDATGTLLLSFEVEDWNPGGTSLVWVKAPSFAPGGGIKIWWGCDDPQVTSDPATFTTDGSTWSDGFEAVWHMKQINTLDSTSNARHGVGAGNTTTAGGQIGTALAFDGSGDLVNVPGYNGVLGGTDRTCSAWIHGSDSAGTIFFWGFDAAGSRWGVNVQTDFGLPATLSAKVHSGYRVGSTALNDNAWHHVAVVLQDDGSPDVGEARMYVDGVEESYSATLAHAVTTAVGTPVQMGSGYAGTMDEARIASAARDADWIFAEYMNQGPNHASFSSYGSAVDHAPPYTQWSEASGLTALDDAFDADPDGDDLANGLEWIFGGQPLTGQTSAAPVLSTTATNLILTFTRNDSSESSTTLYVQWSTDLVAWTDVPVTATSSGPDPSGIGISVIENAATPDAVTVTVPRSLGADGRLFLRLKAATP